MKAFNELQDIIDNEINVREHLLDIRHELEQEASITNDAIEELEKTISELQEGLESVIHALLVNKLHIDKSNVTQSRAILNSKSHYK